MRLKTNKSGFTLLEIIIVIIIIGVLASLALPRLFSTIEFSRSSEALATITAIRSSMERCYLQNDATYKGCGDGDTGANGFDELDIDDPQTSPNSHFSYAITGADTTGYTITATRNSNDGSGAVGNTITLVQSSTDVTRSGTGAYSGLK